MSGFYFVYWVVPDNFTPFALCVTITLLALWKAQTEQTTRWWILTGIGAGLCHLSRVDGALLLLLIAIVSIFLYLRGNKKNITLFFRHSTAAALGYFLLMGPWWLRNWLVVGHPFPGGGV